MRGQRVINFDGTGERSVPADRFDGSDGVSTAPVDDSCACDGNTCNCVRFDANRAIQPQGRAELIRQIQELDDDFRDGDSRSTEYLSSYLDAMRKRGTRSAPIGTAHDCPDCNETERCEEHRSDITERTDMANSKSNEDIEYKARREMIRRADSVGREGYLTPKSAQEQERRDAEDDPEQAAKRRFLDHANNAWKDKPSDRSLLPSDERRDAVDPDEVSRRRAEEHANNAWRGPSGGEAA